MRPELDERTGRVVGPLRGFSAAEQIEFARAAAQPTPPPRWKRLGNCQIPSRAYERGIDYRKIRQDIPAWMREQVIERDGNLCGICEKPVEEPPHFDHVHPVILGGPTEAHPSCNLSKGARVD